jgi:signal transduction histidine kinase
MNPQDMSRLYTPFERLGAENRDVPGTGLGLAVSKSLVQAMGGDIQAQSTLGAGSTFSIILPLAIPPSTTSRTFQ